MTRTQLIARRYRDLTIQQIVKIACRLENQIRASNQTLYELQDMQFAFAPTAIAIDQIRVNTENQLKYLQRQLLEVEIAIESREDKRGGAK